MYEVGCTSLDQSNGCRNKLVWTFFNVRQPSIDMANIYPRKAHYLSRNNSVLVVKGPLKLSYDFQEHESIGAFKIEEYIT